MTSSTAVDSEDVKDEVFRRGGAFYAEQRVRPPMTDRLVLEKELWKCEMAIKALRKEVRNLRREMAGEKSLFQNISRERKKLGAHRSSAVGKTRFCARRSLLGHFGKVYALDWSSMDERRICSSSQDGNLIVWDAHRCVKRAGIPLKSSWVMACQLSAYDTHVACGGLDNRVTVYTVRDSEGWAERSPFCELSYHGSYVSCIRFVATDASKLLSSSGDMTCLRWDVVKAMPDRHFLDHTGDVMAMATPPAGRGPLSGHCFVSVACDNSAKLWDFRAEGCCGNFEAHSEDVNTADFFPDGFAFLTGSDDSTMKLLDIRAYRALNTYRVQASAALQSPTEASASALTPSIQSYAAAPAVTGVRCSHSGKYAFAAYDNSPHMCCWNLADTRVTQQFATLFTRVSALDLNCSGKALATGSWDFMVTVWS